jgi:hypothetical protein
MEMTREQIDADIISAMGEDPEGDLALCSEWEPTLNDGLEDL